MCLFFCLCVSPNNFSILLSFPLWSGNYFVEEFKLKNINPYPLSLFCILSFQSGLFFADVLLYFPILRSRLLFGVGSCKELSCSVSCPRGMEFRAHYFSKAGDFGCLLVCVPAQSAIEHSRGDRRVQACTAAQEFVLPLLAGWLWSSGGKEKKKSYYVMSGRKNFSTFNCLAPSKPILEGTIKIKGLWLQECDYPTASDLVCCG